ncbi:MAG: ABC transporter ATP-binding protein, partial [Anaerolineae bacterium]|nr:ABC transporter ATP-binding protein [Anaerolineae bacterium]
MGPLRRQYLDLLVTYLKPQWQRALLLAVLLFSSIGLQLVTPQIIRAFIDATQSGGATATLLRLALLFMVMALVQQAVSVAATYASESVGWTATHALRGDLVRHCLGLDMSFHNAHTPGEMIERVDGDVSALSNFFSQFVIQIAGNFLLLLGILALLFREDWRVGLLLTAFALLSLFILGRLAYIAVPYWKAQRQANADLFGYLEERLAGTEDIRANGAKAYVMRGLYVLMRVLMEKSRKAGVVGNILVVNAIVFLFALGMAIALGIGAYLYLAGAVTIGTVYIIYVYSTMIVEPINRITQQVQELQQAGAGIARVQELLHTNSKLQDQSQASSDGSLLPSEPLAVEFQRVSFGYGTDSPGEGVKEMVLRDLSFRLQPGTVLGLLGRTGSGKTTLARLLFRLHDPDQGIIRLGRDTELRDIRDVPLGDLRRRIGMVTQEIQLFHATVRDNLTFFDSAIPDQQILQVLQELGLWDWYCSLSKGLDTELESGGGGLSAGAAQVLDFPRVFLHDPGLVILDEASSRL